MTAEIKCPKCSTEMTEGFILDRLNVDAKMKSARVEGQPEESFWSGLKTSNRRVLRVQAFRCPKCNYLEFYTAEEVYF
jgi:predicted nucleic-acid-binding Zn-ribbon protein